MKFKFNFRSSAKSGSGLKPRLPDPAQVERLTRLVSVMCAILIFIIIVSSMVPNSVSAAEIVPSKIESMGTFVDDVINNIAVKLLALEDKIGSAALKLFGGLLVCQLAWSIGMLMLNHGMTVSGLYAALIRQLLTAGFFYWFLTNRWVLETILQSYVGLGEVNLSPGSMFQVLDNCCEQIMKVIGEKTAWREQGICLYISGFVACVSMLVGVGSSIMYMVVVILENYVLGVIGFFFLGFGASDYTRDYAKGYIKALIHVGFKLFLISIVVNVGLEYFAASVKNVSVLTDTGIIRICLQFVAISVLYATLVKVVPNVADALFKNVTLNSQGFLHDLLAAIASRPVTVNVESPNYVNPVDAASNAYMSPAENTLHRTVTEEAAEP